MPCSLHNAPILHNSLAASELYLPLVLQISEGWLQEREELLAKLSGLESWKNWANTHITQLIQRVKVAERPPNKDDSLRLKDEVRRWRRVVRHATASQPGTWRT